MSPVDHGCYVYVLVWCYKQSVLRDILPSELWHRTMSHATMQDYRHLVCGEQSPTSGRVDGSDQTRPRACGVSLEFYSTLKASLVEVHFQRLPSPVCGGVWACSRSQLQCCPIRTLKGVSVRILTATVGLCDCASDSWVHRMPLVHSVSCQIEVRT